MMSRRRDPELDLVVAGPLDAAGDRDDLGAGRLLGAEALEPVGAAVDDDVGTFEQRLDVVDQRRAAVEARIAGNGGFSRGLPRLPSSESSSAVSSPQM